MFENNFQVFMKLIFILLGEVLNVNVLAMVISHTTDPSPAILPVERARRPLLIGDTGPGAMPAGFRFRSRYFRCPSSPESVTSQWCMPGS